ncbi:hypothetical protein GDO78_017608 [Eleutherodactylus coqui]|uniref:Uncharacterized protein n=1 Tax=Eleutherodactylus coqui TaxID=57060 RepID=A0A8J6BDJ2_ELECQ|nr:hypothetical protein GDO78_017608 [Eleutherodactylus coqui]
MLQPMTALRDDRRDPIGCSSRTTGYHKQRASIAKTTAGGDRQVERISRFFILQHGGLVRGFYTTQKTPLKKQFGQN